MRMSPESAWVTKIKESKKQDLPPVSMEFRFGRGW